MSENKLFWFIYCQAQFICEFDIKSKIKINERRSKKNLTKYLWCAKTSTLKLG